MTSSERLRAAMHRALDAARETHPHPNPRVGAVVLDALGHEIASAAHRAPGEPHAEVLALRQAGNDAAGATMVVTLEPCDHHGRTPPCTEALIEAGVARVVVGALDPDERVSGAGVRRLEHAGITVDVGVACDAVEAADPAYFHHRRTGMPLVTLKSAVTLDGQTAAADGTSQWITGEDARIDAHRLRAEHDAVLVGAGTVRVDDPQLNVRLAGYDGPQPTPIIVAGQRPLPPAAQIWHRNPIVLAAGPVSAPTDRVIQAGSRGRVDMRAGLRAVAELGHLSILAEGGSGMAAALWDADLIDRGVWYVGARVAGGVGRATFDRTFGSLDQARTVEIEHVTRLGADVRIDWSIRRP